MTRFLDELEYLSLQRRDEYLRALHDDMQASISDHSARAAADFTGGKREFCDYVSYATRGLGPAGRIRRRRSATISACAAAGCIPGPPK